MPKNKPPPKSARKRTQQARLPESADEYLALGVESEEAGEKWRMGDAAKSARFFVRALEIYAKGLEKHPRSFDLAYNKARIQYQTTQYPALCAEFPGTLKQLLQVALESHSEVLSLDRRNADVLFNTAQVMTSLAEAIDSETRLTPDTPYQQQPVRLVKDAIDLFQQCLALQELSYSQSQAEMAMAVENGIGNAVDGRAVETEDDEAFSEVPEQWASIVEPVTKATLAETGLGLLDALTTLCGLSDTPDSTLLQEIERLAEQLLVEKLPVYLDDVEEQIRDEVLYSKVRFAAGLAELQYCKSVTSAASYDKALKQAFDGCTNAQEVKPKMEVLLAYADAIIAFNAAVSRETGCATLRWTRLTKALECLTSASKLLSPMVVDGLVSVNASRGDVELLRLSLCALPDLHENIRNSQVQATLLKNARTYYHKAGEPLRSSAQTAAKRDLIVVSIKESLTQCLEEGTNAPLQRLHTLGMDASTIGKVVEEMLDDSLVSTEMLSNCNLSDFIINT